jgi:hypothetical protein
LGPHSLLRRHEDREDAEGILAGGKNRRHSGGIGPTMKGTSSDNSSSSGQLFGMEERELRVGMGLAASGEAKGAFYRGREEGSGQGVGQSVR